MSPRPPWIPPARPRRPGEPVARLVALVGPTAVGKTGLAVSLCEAFDGEVVSLDSRQMRRGLDRGTAKPSAAERAAAPHHLVDIAEPDEDLDLSAVQALALEAIADIAGRGRLPVVAGGTGQYVWALLEGWRIPRVPPDPAFRAAREAEAEALGRAALHARLAAIDPASAEAIHPNNLRRVIRALEIFAATGRPPSEARGKEGLPWPVLLLGLRRPRPALYARIDARVDAMLAAGLEDEVRALVAAGFGFDLPAMSSLGYREWEGYLAGEIDRAEVRRLIRRNTRRLARNQDTWFRADDPRIAWLDLAADGVDEGELQAAAEAAAESAAESEALSEAMDRVRAFLAAPDDALARAPGA